MKNKWLSQALVVVSAAVLTACGGGGSEGEVAAPVAQLPQGVWKATQADSKLAVLVLPDTYDGTVWAVKETPQGTTVYNASLTPAGGTFKGEGRLIESTSNNVSASVPVVLSSSTKPTTLSFAVNGESPAQLTYTAEYDQPATLAEWAGNWAQQASAGQLGFTNMQWTLDAEGKITGRRNDGCTYSGHIALRKENRAAVDVVVQENCPGMLSSQYWGYGLPRRDDAGALEGRDVTILRADGRAVSLLKFWPASTDL